MHRCGPRDLFKPSVVFTIFLLPPALHAQTAPIPVRPGLWEMQVSIARAIALAPEMEARIAAMPPDQQAQMRAMIGGAASPGASKPLVTTKQVCLAPKSSMDTLIGQAQQVTGLQCTVANKVQTPRGGSYDVSCNVAMGSAKGHATYRLVDETHLSGVSHMTVTGAAGGLGALSMDASTTGKFLNADCGEEKPFSAPAASGTPASK